jgi:hypothetical protein
MHDCHIVKFKWNSIVTKTAGVVINSTDFNPPNFNSPDFNPADFVIPSEARDLHFAANYRSLASLGMTIR